MVQDHLGRERDSADEQRALRRERCIPPYRHLRKYRICGLLVLVLFGLHLLATGSGAGTGDPLTAQQAAPDHASIQTAQASEHRTPLAVGMGVGASSNERMGVTAQAAVCLNPLDVTCWLQNAAQWVAQQITSALQPVINAILQSPLNIITQTPPADTYQNPTVLTWFSAFLTVVDLALASLIVIGGYNVIVGRELGLLHSGFAEFLPRLLLAFGAAHFSLYFLGLYIDLENALCGVALNLARPYYRCLTPERAILRPLPEGLLAAVGWPTSVKRRTVRPHTEQAVGSGHHSGAGLSAQDQAELALPLPDVLHLVDLLAPEYIEVSPDALRVGQEYACGLAVTACPREVSFDGWLAPLLLHDEVFDLSFHYHPQDTAAMKRQLARNRAGHASGRRFNRREGRADDPDALLAEEDLSRLLDDLARSRERVAAVGE